MFFVSKKKYDELEQKRVDDAIDFKNKIRIKKADLEIKDKIIKELKKDRVLNAKKIKEIYGRTGGLTKQNNRLKKLYEIEKNNLDKAEKYITTMLLKIKEMQNTINLVTKDNKVLNDQKIKLQGIVDELNKIVSKKMRPSPDLKRLKDYHKK